MKVLLLALFLVPSAVAHGDNHITIIAKDNFFELEGETTQNAVLDLEGGEDFEITLRNEGNGRHDLQIDWDKDGAADFVVDNNGELLNPGEEVTVDFMVPANARGGAYWCKLHNAAGMNGQVSVAGDKESPGLGMLGAFAAIALVGFARGRR